MPAGGAAPPFPRGLALFVNACVFVPPPPPQHPPEQAIPMPCAGRPAGFLLILFFPALSAEGMHSDREVSCTVMENNIAELHLLTTPCSFAILGLGGAMRIAPWPAHAPRQVPLSTACTYGPSATRICRVCPRYIDIGRRRPKGRTGEREWGGGNGAWGRADVCSLFRAHSMAFTIEGVVGLASRVFGPPTAMTSQQPNRFFFGAS